MLALAELDCYLWAVDQLKTGQPWSGVSGFYSNLVRDKTFVSSWRQSTQTSIDVVVVVVVVVIVVTLIPSIW